jgi:hypothetical protein
MGFSHTCCAALGMVLHGGLAGWAVVEMDVPVTGQFSRLSLKGG